MPPPIPPPPIPPGLETISPSAESRDEAFRGEEKTGDGGSVLQAVRVTFFGSTTPALTRSSKTPVATL